MFQHYIIEGYTGYKILLFFLSWYIDIFSLYSVFYLSQITWKRMRRLSEIDRTVAQHLYTVYGLGGNIYLINNDIYSLICCAGWSLVRSMLAAGSSCLPSSRGWPTSPGTPCYTVQSAGTSCPPSSRGWPTSPGTACYTVPSTVSWYNLPTVITGLTDQSRFSMLCI